jgi:hypothetical protein
MAPAETSGMQPLAATASHVPNTGSPARGGMTYYGYYSHVNSSKGKMEEKDERITSLLKPFEDPYFSGEECSRASKGN